MGRRNLASSSSHAWLVVVVLVCVLSHQVAGANARPGPRSRFDRIQDVLTTSENTLRWLRDLDIGPSDSPSEWKVPLLRPAPPKPKQCHDYESKANCWDAFPSASPEPVPDCPSSLLKTLGPHRVNRTFFAVVGDFGLNGSGCSERVGDLLKKIEKQFGRFAFVVSGGDNAYWDGSCNAHREVYNKQVYGDYFPSKKIKCVDPIKLRNSDWRNLSPYNATSASGRFTPDPSLPRVMQLAQRIAHIRSLLGRSSPPTPVTSLSSPSSSSSSRGAGAGAGATASNSRNSNEEAPPPSPEAEALIQEGELAERAVLADLLSQFTVAGDPSALDPDIYRYFPSLGNHDFDEAFKTAGPMPYNQYFPYLGRLPPGDDLSGGMWYTFISPLERQVQFFIINSNLGKWNNEHDTLLYRAQAKWLKHALGSSAAQFKVVVLHHPPHSTAVHDANAQWMNLPYKAWGADYVIAGHQHAYERLMLPPELATLPPEFKDELKPGISPNASAVYLLNGLGGHPWVYTITGCDTHPGSQVRFNNKHGFLIGALTKTSQPFTWSQPPTSSPASVSPVPQGAMSELSFCFYSIDGPGKLVDNVSLFS